MSTTSHLSKDQPHQQRSPHDWHSHDYVTKWSEGQDQKEVDRQEPFRLLAEGIPYDKQLPIKILDVGAGYGALTQFILKHFPNATAVCQDNSEEMTALGKKRMQSLNGRFAYVRCDFRESGWSRVVPGPFEAIVSSIAIHNARSAEIMRNIYSEIFPVVKAGGCFLSYDVMTVPLEEHMRWLREIGFENVRSFWQFERRALFGGFK